MHGAAMTKEVRVDIIRNLIALLFCGEAILFHPFADSIAGQRLYFSLSDRIKKRTIRQHILLMMENG